MCPNPLKPTIVVCNNHKVQSIEGVDYGQVLIMWVDKLFKYSLQHMRCEMKIIYFYNFKNLIFTLQGSLEVK